MLHFVLLLSFRLVLLHRNLEVLPRPCLRELFYAGAMTASYYSFQPVYYLDLEVVNRIYLIPGNMNQLKSEFLAISSDVRLHIPTLDMLSAVAGSRIYVFDRDGRYLYISEAGAQIIGMTQQFMLGKTIYELNFSAESIEQLGRDLGLVFATGTASSGENWVQTPNGIRNSAYTLCPLVGKLGEVNAVAVTVMDITARKRAEEALARKQEETEILNAQLRRAITETHHRVKNNLQLITAMIDMRMMQHPALPESAAEAGDVKVFSIEDMKRLCGCVRTLAVVHDLLTQESKTDARNARVSIKCMLERLLPLMEQTLQIARIGRHLEDVSLSIRHSTSLALITNELVSNAIKYGNGKIDVAVVVTDINAALIVIDDGTGFAADFNSAQAANTGLELVESLTRIDLGGTVTYANQQQGGGQVTITIPLSPDNQTENFQT